MDLLELSSKSIQDGAWHQEVRGKIKSGFDGCFAAQKLFTYSL